MPNFVVIRKGINTNPGTAGLDNDLVPCDDPARSQLDFEAIAKAITGKSDTKHTTTTTSNDENDKVSETYGHEISSEANEPEKPYSKEEFETDSNYAITEKMVNSTTTKDLGLWKAFQNFVLIEPHSMLRGHSKTTLTVFCPILTTYLPPVDIFTK